MSGPQLPDKSTNLEQTDTSSQLTLVRCGVCGIFAPQKLGYGGKIVSSPCAHRAWRSGGSFLRSSFPSAHYPEAKL